MTAEIAEDTGPQGILERAHELLGVPMSWRPPRSGEPEKPDLETIAAVAREGGLRTNRFAAPPLAVLQSLSPRRPVVTLDEHGFPLLLLEERGGRFCVEDGAGARSWLTVAMVVERLGLAHGGVEHTWLALDSPASLSVPLTDDSTPWQNAIALIRSEGSNLGSIVIYAIGVGLLSLALPLAVQMLVNTVAFGQLIQPILVLTVLLAGGLIFAATLRAIQAWMVEIVQRRLFVKLVSELADRLPRAHVEAFEKGQGPELVNRFFDVFTAQKTVAQLLLGGIEALLTALVGLVVLAFYHPALFGFGLVLTASALVVFVTLGRGATSTTIAESKAKYAVAGWLEEMARHLFALKMAGGGDYARRRLDALATQWLDTRSAHFRVYYRQFMGALALQVIAHATLLGLGGWLVVERELTIGQLVAAELIVTAVVASLSKLGGKLESVYDLVAAADKLGVLLGLPLEQQGGDDPICGGRAARVELREVSSAGGELKDFDLVIEAGARVAIHGDRHASTALVDLLFGLRLPKRGAVMIDGQDLRDVRLDALRSRIAVVREREVLPGTVADNIRSVGRHVPASEIWETLAQARLAGAVRNLPRGLQTELMPSGAPLDRLDALRLTLARAIAARPALLVLDGVIDALPEEERGPLLETINRNRTLVVLTHEQAVVNDCGSCIELEPNDTRTSPPTSPEEVTS